MNQVLEISPETILKIESYARHTGVSVDEYVRSLLPSHQTDLGLAADLNGDFITDMEAFADGGVQSPYSGSYSREDIYADHN